MTDLLRAEEGLSEDVRTRELSGTTSDKMLLKATEPGGSTSDDRIAQMGPHGASASKLWCNTSSRLSMPVDSSTSLLQQHFWGSEGKQQSAFASTHYPEPPLRHSTASCIYEYDRGCSGLRCGPPADLTAFLNNQWTRPNILRQRSDKCFKQLLAFVSRRTPSQAVKLPTIPKTPLVVLTKPRLKVHSDTSEKNESDDTDPAVEESSAPRRYSSRQRRAPARLREVQSHQQPEDADNPDDEDYAALDHVDAKGGDFDTGNSSDDVLSPRYVRPTSRRKSPPLLDDMQQTLHNHHHMMNHSASSQRRPVSKRPRLEKKNDHVTLHGSDFSQNHDDETERAQAANALAMLCARNQRGVGASEANEKPAECSQQ